MDRNKLKVLQEIGYEIVPTCGLCAYSKFPQNDWGTCLINWYDHEKHSDSKRLLSIHKSGTCPNYQPSDVSLEGFDQLRRQ